MEDKLTPEEIDAIVSDIMERTTGLEDDWQEKGAPPSKYKPEYCKKLIEYFNKPPYEEYTNIGGKQRWSTDLPTIERFATSIGITKPTYYFWIKHFPDFAEAASMANQMQEHILVTNGLHGGYSPGIVSMIAKNRHGYVDKLETVNENKTTHEIDAQSKEILKSLGINIDDNS